MSSSKIIAVLFFQILFSSSIFASVYYVSPLGDNTNTGASEIVPFKTVQFAIDQMVSGDVLMVMDGFYAGEIHLKSGITMNAINPRKVTFSSAELIRTTFEQYSGGIYRTPIGAKNIKQLFFDDIPLTWAQWPNIQWSENWDTSKKWKSATTGTGPGVLTSNAFNEISNLDVTGGYCFIRYGKGNSCYSRLIESFDGTVLHWNDDDFYDKKRTGEDGPRGSAEALLTLNTSHQWHPNKSRFFLAGDLDLLDAPGEWFVENGFLYLYPPTGMDINNSKVIANTLSYVIDEATTVSNITINGIDFFATSVRFGATNTSNIKFYDSQFTYIGAEHLLIDRIHAETANRPVTVNGTNIEFEKCLFAGAQNSALQLIGGQLKVKNCVFMENNRHANFQSRALVIKPSSAYQVTQNTFFNNCSDAIMVNPKKYDDTIKPEVSYNNIFNAGLYNSDVSGIYLPILSQEYTDVHHNWLHNVNGNAVRLDVAGSELSVHHNVLWENGRGLNIEGYFGFNIYNNTAVHDKHGSSVTQNVSSHFGDRTDAAAAANKNTFPPISQWNIVNNIVEIFLDRIGPREVPLYDAATAHNLRKNSKDITVTNRNKVRANLIGDVSGEFIHYGLDNLNLIPDKSTPAPTTKTVDQIQSQTSVLTRANLCCLDSFRGAYAINDPNPWVPGSDWMPLNLSVLNSMASSEQFAKSNKNVSFVPSINTDQLSLSVEKIKEVKVLTIRPNPVKNRFTIQLDKTEKSASLFIYGVAGRLIYQMEYSNVNTIKLEGSVLIKGVNTLRVITDKVTYSAKLIKE